MELTTNDFAALALLVRHAGKVLSRDEILQELRGIDCEAFNRSVDITVSRVRQKLNDDPKAPLYIKTVWGTGYVFIGGKAAWRTGEKSPSASSVRSSPGFWP